MMNQLGLIEVEDHDELEMSSSSSQMGLIFYPHPFGTNMISSVPSTINSLSPPFLCNQSPRKSTNFTTTTIPSSSSLAAADSPKDQDHFGGPPHQLLSLQRSAHINLWAWGEENDCIISSNNNYIKRRNNIGAGENDDHNHNLGISAIKMKKIKSGGGGRRKVREPRFCFKTLSTDVDVLDDGYKWRKYGQKVVKNTLHPRSYYRCTQDNCRVKKRVERLAEDPRMVITTYEGRHVHSPSQDEEDSSSQLNNFLW